MSPSRRLELVSNKMDQLKALIGKFLESSKSLLIVADFISPSHPKLGIYDVREPAGEKAIIQKLNQILVIN